MRHSVLYWYNLHDRVVPSVCISDLPIIEHVVLGVPISMTYLSLNTWSLVSPSAWPTNHWTRGPWCPYQHDLPIIEHVVLGVPILAQYVSLDGCKQFQKQNLHSLVNSREWFNLELLVDQLINAITLEWFIPDGNWIALSFIKCAYKGVQVCAY